MKTKPLYVFVSDGGDGSYSVQYTLNSELVAKLQQAYDDDRLPPEEIGCDGDGFHYDTIMVPIECTPKSLGIDVLDDSYADQYDE